MAARDEELGERGTDPLRSGLLVLRVDEAPQVRDGDGLDRERRDLVDDRVELCLGEIDHHLPLTIDAFRYLDHVLPGHERVGPGAQAVVEQLLE